MAKEYAENAPQSLAIKEGLTEASRKGASSLRPVLAGMSAKQQARIVKALRKNNRPRLEAILEDYARTLNAVELDSILAEGVD